MTEAIQDFETPTKQKKSGGFDAGSIFLLVAVVFAVVVVGVALARQNQTRPAEGDPAPEFAFTTFDGEEYTMADLRGKVVMINFWASWCAPCHDEAADLQAAWEHYEDGGEVVFLGIAYADNGPASLEYLAQYDITYLNAPDFQTRISEMYHIEGVPETFIIDKDGNVAEFIYAGISEERLRAIIDPLLASDA